MTLPEKLIEHFNAAVYDEQLPFLRDAAKNNTLVYDAYEQVIGDDRAWCRCPVATIYGSVVGSRYANRLAINHPVNQFITSFDEVCDEFAPHGAVDDIGDVWTTPEKKRERAREVVIELLATRGIIVEREEPPCPTST